MTNSNTTCIRDVVVKLENGLHLGPSSQIVQLAQKFKSELWIRKGDRTVDGKSMLDLLTLAAEHGTVLAIEARGADANARLVRTVQANPTTHRMSERDPVRPFSPRAN